jgi:hypothetical protein
VSVFSFGLLLFLTLVSYALFVIRYGKVVCVGVCVCVCVRTGLRMRMQGYNEFESLRLCAYLVEIMEPALITNSTHFRFLPFSSIEEDLSSAWNRSEPNVDGMEILRYTNTMHRKMFSRYKKL